MMTDDTERDERLWRLLEVSDILDEINFRFSAFIENFVKIETDKVKAAGYEEKDRAITKAELERIKNVYIQEVEKNKQEFIQYIFSEMKPDLYKISPENVELNIAHFESEAGKSFKAQIIPLSEKMNKAITEIGGNIIRKA